jgi:protein-disulfide isomerase
MGRLGFWVLLCSLMAGAQNGPSNANAAAAPKSAPVAHAAASKTATPAAKAAKTESVTPDKPEGMTHDQADAILNELRAIHQLLVAQGPTRAIAPVPEPAPAAPPNMVGPAPPGDKVQMKMDSGWHWMGRDDAPVTIVEFTDYQCPFCRKYHTETFVQLKKNYIDTGKVRFASRDLPLDFHASAQRAAEAAWCAGEQNKYWELRDTMINSSDLSPDAILRYAQTNAFDIPKFKNCADAGKYKAEIKKDIADAGTVGISATPSFVIGKTAKDAMDAMDGDRVVGAVPASVFESEIQKFTTVK